MKQSKRKAARWLLPIFVAFALSGCAVYETVPAAGHYVVNADGSRTFVPGAYSCPNGYTCYYPSSVPATGTVTYAPVYYDGYPATYVGSAPYLWPPLFFGLGYYWGSGYHHHYRHYHPHHRSRPSGRTRR